MNSGCSKWSSSNCQFYGNTSQKGTSLPKSSSNFDPSLLSQGLEKTIQNETVKKNCDIDKNSGFITNLLKYRMLF